MSFKEFPRRIALHAFTMGNSYNIFSEYCCDLVSQKGCNAISNIVWGKLWSFSWQKAQSCGGEKEKQMSSAVWVTAEGLVPLTDRAIICSPPDSLNLISQRPETLNTVYQRRGKKELSSAFCSLFGEWLFCCHVFVMDERQREGK